MKNKPFESILNYLKDENVISKKEFDYLNNDEAAAKNSILYYYNNVDDPNVNMLVEINWDYFLELEEEQDMEIIYSLDELPLKVKKNEIFSCGDKLIKIERLKIQKVSGIPIYKVSLDRNSFEKLKDRQQRKLLKIQVNENKKYFTVATVDVRKKIIEIFKSFNIRI